MVRHGICWRGLSLNFVDMVQKESLHLGQKVLYGERREEAVVDALTQTGLGLCVGDRKYVVASYEDVYCER